MIAPLLLDNGNEQTQTAAGGANGEDKAGSTSLESARNGMWERVGNFSAGREGNKVL